MSLAGKVALITGTTSGVGRALAMVFAEQGARVVGIGRREGLGRSLEREVRDRGAELSFVPADVRLAADCEASVAHALRTYGRLDILINNAGVEGPVGHFHDLAEAEWDSVMETNVKGTAFCCRYAIPPMIEHGGGVVLNVASINAVVALAHMAPYNASKAAVVQLTRSLAVEYLAQGIRANAIILGGVEGGTNERTQEGLRRFLRGAEYEVSAPAADTNAMRQDPVEVAKVFALLCDDDAKLITGATIAIDRAITAGSTASALIHLKFAQQP